MSAQDSFIAPPSNIVGSSNQVGTVTITDSAGNVVKIEKVTLNDPISDFQAFVDSGGALSVAVVQDARGASELTTVRRLLELVLLEIQALNASFLAANPGLIGTQAQDTSTVQ